MNNLAFFLSSRYLLARRRGIFTLLTTLISIGGIALGVAALIVTLAIMTGFQNDIRRRLLLVQPHIMIYGDSAGIQGRLLEFVSEMSEAVVGVAPYAYGNFLLQSGRTNRGVVIKGVEPQAEKKLLEESRAFPDSIARVLPDDLSRGIVLGKGLAELLGVNENDWIVLLSPTISSLSGGFFPRATMLRVRGIFQTGLYEYDSNFAYVDIEFVRKIMGSNAQTGWAINLKDSDRAGEVARKLERKLLGEAPVRSWMEMNKNLFSALRLEKVMMFLVLTLIVIVAAFNIISVLVMFTVEKARDIGILRALGASSRTIYQIFFLEGFFLGAIGTFLGLIIGLGVVKLLHHYPLNLPADVYYISKLPVKVVASDVAIVGLAAFLITIFASIYPAYQATRVSPIDVLRYG